MILESKSMNYSFISIYFAAFFLFQCFQSSAVNNTTTNLSYLRPSSVYNHMLANNNRIEYLQSITHRLKAVRALLKYSIVNPGKPEIGIHELTQIAEGVPTFDTTIKAIEKMCDGFGIDLMFAYCPLGYEFVFPTGNQAANEDNPNEDANIHLFDFMRMLQLDEQQGQRPHAPQDFRRSNIKKIRQITIIIQQDKSYKLQIVALVGVNRNGIVDLTYLTNPLSASLLMQIHVYQAENQESCPKVILNTIEEPTSPLQATPIKKELGKFCQNMNFLYYFLTSIQPTREIPVDQFTERILYYLTDGISLTHFGTLMQNYSHYRYLETFFHEELINKRR